MQGKSPGSTRGLNLQTPLYLGGVDRQLMRVSDGVGVQRGLIGCVGSLRVDDRELELLAGRQDAANVGQCAASRPCERRPCLNGATCRDTGYQPDQFQCDCVGGFSGKRCEVRPGPPAGEGTGTYETRGGEGAGRIRGLGSRGARRTLMGWRVGPSGDGTERRRV